MTKTRVARSSGGQAENVIWDPDSPLAVSLACDGDRIETRHGRFVGGRSDGVELVRIDTGAAIIDVLPTRGMALRDIRCDAVRFGWNSPVAGPVHPSLVPTFDPGGLGWLEGFDELLARCGLESNGAPEHDRQGRLLHPLHGRIGNLPADALEIEFDEVSGRLELIGEFRESRLFFSNFRLQSRLRVHAGSPKVEILDDVTNEASRPADMQLLYHINVGTPVLDAGSKVVLPLAELAPKDDRSAAEMDAWDEYGGPQSGYTERVYFARLRSDESNQTTAMLRNADQSRGLAVHCGTKTLPNFIVWKNTADLADGYVTGLEPATNFPNPRSFEAEQGRVVTIGPEQTACFRVSLEPLLDKQAVAQTQDRIEKLAGEDPPQIHARPQSGWSPGV